MPDAIVAATVADTAGKEAAKGVFGAALKSIGPEAIGAGLLSGGIAAAIPLAVRGISELTPQAREERRTNRKNKREAEAAVEKGKKSGFGPGARRRQIQVQQRTNDYRAQTAKQRDNMQRQQSMLGIGRSGVQAAQVAALAKQDADVVGQVRSQVEDEARTIGRQNKAAAYSRLNMVHGIQAKKAAEAKQFAGQVGTQAVGVGMRAGAATKDRLEADTRDQAKLKALQARLLQGISPTSVEDVNGRPVDTRTATA